MMLTVICIDVLTTKHFAADQVGRRKIPRHPGLRAKEGGLLSAFMTALLSPLPESKKEED